MAESPEPEEAAVTPPPVETAWRRCAELRAAADRAERRDVRLQAGFIAVSFMAVSVAILGAVGGLLAEGLSFENGDTAAD